MRMVTLIHIMPNSRAHLSQGGKVLNAEWADWGQGVLLHYEQNTAAPIAEMYIASFSPGMAIPDNAEFLAVLRNPFVLLYAIPEVT